MSGEKDKGALPWVMDSKLSLTDFNGHEGDARAARLLATGDPAQLPAVLGYLNRSPLKIDRVTMMCAGGEGASVGVIRALLRGSLAKEAPTPPEAPKPGFDTYDKKRFKKALEEPDTETIIFYCRKANAIFGGKDEVPPAANAALARGAITLELLEIAKTLSIPLGQDGLYLVTYKESDGQMGARIVDARTDPPATVATLTDMSGMN